MEIFGLPLHPLIVHAAVVFVPLAALGGLLVTFFPRLRARYGWLTAAFGLEAAVSALAARLSGSATHTPRIWRYYWDSIEACAPPASILQTLRAAGLENVDRHVELGTFSEYRARKPG